MVQLVGILNITPDSFSDGGQYFSPEAAISHARALCTDGASIVDVGAESTRPHATPLTDDEEWRRLEPVLSALLAEFPNRISLDSYHPKTVRKALDIGHLIINDVTSLRNPEMFKVVLELRPTIVISHLPTDDIQTAHRAAAVQSVDQVKTDLLKKVDALVAKGFPKSQIILDPGIGFGKTMELNWELLKFAEVVPDFPVMIGYSRKRFLGEQRMELAPNIAAGKIAVTHGAAYLRVHDVKGHAQQL